MISVRSIATVALTLALGCGHAAQDGPEGQDARAAEGGAGGGAEPPRIDPRPDAAAMGAGGSPAVDAAAREAPGPDRLATADAPLAPDRAAAGDAGATGPAAVIDGTRWEVPCGTLTSNSETCTNYPAGKTSCPAGGNYNLDRTVTFGGARGTFYDVAVRIRGVVEPKPYRGGMSDGMHFYVGGQPVTTGEDGVYNTYSITVSSPAQSYYLNYDEGKGVGHYVFTIDHMKTIRIEGGATVKFLGLDTNCSTIRNCVKTGPNCTPYIVPDVPPAPKAFDGQYIQLDVVSVTPAR
jgi:hypothetical protein